MSQTMIIDALHPEETRVVIIEGEQIVNYETESISRKPLKGNIYLAKVVRVEPSLQAAFVDYGQKRQGFLAFDEIHPDYFQIPAEDKQLLLKQQKDIIQAEKAKAQDLNNNQNNGCEIENINATNKKIKIKKGNYKIQAVIKKKQIILVQVVREERGNKGAALTTYISIPSRYTVLMPNTARGSGLSRKITDINERKKLLKVAKDIKIPENMGLIIRTAGANQTRKEIQRDYEYLIRIWNDVRETTLNSLAPELVYQEGDIIKRAIRDDFDKKITEVVVAGEQAHKEAKQFMKIFMPKSEKKVKKYRHKTPVMLKYGAENQINNIYSPNVPLKSGGYIVIDKTEAVITIDVNSGSATKERTIENTAFKTNMEAAEEIAKQLKLRDLAGLIVVDFIDMEQKSNNRIVELHVKKSLSSDRARVQVGHISQFGLLEMSRQRLKLDVLEDNAILCPHCQGTGNIKTIGAIALKVIRQIENKAASENIAKVIAEVHNQILCYIFNKKREYIKKLEDSNKLQIELRDSLSNNIMHYSLYIEKIPQRIIEQNKNEIKEKTINEVEKKPVQNQGQKPVQNQGQKPIQNQGQKPIQNQGQKPVQNQGQKPIQNQGQKPVQNQGQKPVQNQGNELNNQKLNNQKNNRKEQEKTAGKKKNAKAITAKNMVNRRNKMKKEQEAKNLKNKKYYKSEFTENTPTTKINVQEKTAEKIAEKTAEK